MQATNSAETSTTSTPAASPNAPATDASAFYTYGWVLPFTIACAVIYWYLTKPRRAPSEGLAIDRKDMGSEATPNGESRHSTGFKPRKQVNKKLAKKKNRVKLVNEAEQASPTDADDASQHPSQQNSGTLSKRQRKLLAAKSVEVDRNLVGDRSAVGATTADNRPMVGDADQASTEAVPAVQAIFAPIRASVPAVASGAAQPSPEMEMEVSDLPRRRPSDARSKGRPREAETVVAKPIVKNTVFVPQKREVLVDRSADRWAAMQPANAVSPSTENSTTISKVDEAKEGSANSADASQSPQPHVGLQGFVRKLRAKSVSQSE